MKKHFLLVALLMVVFLWLGDYTSAYTCANLGNCVNNQCKTLAWEEACIEVQPTQPVWDDEANSERQATADQFNASCIDANGSITAESVTYVEDLGNWTCCVSQEGKNMWVALALCTDEQTIAGGSSVPCNVWSLSWSSHAWVSTAGISCHCDPKYGEYYDVNTKKTTCELCSRDDVCCGVKLNTAVPFIGNCIETKTDNPESTLTEETAFPVLMSSLTKILVTVILIVSFVLIVVWGIMIASAWANPANASAGKKLIMKVVIGIALLGASGVILRLINPNFFG